MQLPRAATPRGNRWTVHTLRAADSSVALHGDPEDWKEGHEWDGGWEPVGRTAKDGAGRTAGNSQAVAQADSTGCGNGFDWSSTGVGNGTMKIDFGSPMAFQLEEGQFFSGSFCGMFSSGYSAYNNYRSAKDSMNEVRSSETASPVGMWNMFLRGQGGGGTLLCPVARAWFQRSRSKC